MNPAAEIHLMKAFSSYYGFRELVSQLVIPTEQNPVDPMVSILVLQALYNIEESVKSQQFTGDLNVELKEILRKWRCESQLTASGEYGERSARLLRSLDIFDKFGVPLFIDSYGKKQRLSDYGAGIEQITGIDGNTEIHHVTHKQEADNISSDNHFIPSDNKNIIPGCWFGLPADDSPYGTHVFRTTLPKLSKKITGLRQGEIVSYKDEVNVILYAVDDEEANFMSLMKPTLEAVRENLRESAYVHVSIFVPERFLPQADRFPQAVKRVGVRGWHTMCIRQKRTRYECKEFRVKP